MLIHSTVKKTVTVMLAAVVAGSLCITGCINREVQKQSEADNAARTVEPCPTKPSDAADDNKMPSAPQSKTAGASAKTENIEDIPRYAANSPFDTDYAPPTFNEGKRLWAKSFLWEKAPEIVVEKWLSDKPDTTGKYVLVEFWATWCPPCRRSIKLLNHLHEKYGDELVVIGISDETESDVRKLFDRSRPKSRSLDVPDIQYYNAIDTQARMKDQMGVFGIPHVIIIEPEGHVIWEGFPLLKGYELTDEIIEKIFAAGKQ